jgi:hypothetical protein
MANRDELRDELARAERKIEALRELAHARKLRYERTQAELERLRRSLPQRGTRLIRRAVGRADLHAFCLFVGYPRSGHSLLGSLLDAHPDVAIAQGANVLKDVAEGGMTRGELIDMLVHHAEHDADRIGGRRATGYSYAVPGQWQGHVRALRVVGAKAGEKATLAIRRDPAVLAKLRRTMRTRLRLLHVTRNPFDMVARMASITKDGTPERTIEAATRFTARLAQTNASVIAARPGDVLTVRHEVLVRQPRPELQRIAAFLHIEQPADWLDACCAIMFEAPHQARELVKWKPEEREAVERLIAAHTFFSGYSWTSEN